MRHRPLRLDPFELGGHRGGLERTDPDVQVELVVGILQDDDGHLGGRIERDPAHDHQNEVFPVTSHRRALQFLFRRARLRIEIPRGAWRKYLGPKTPCGQPSKLRSRENGLCQPATKRSTTRYSWLRLRHSST